MRIKSMNLVRMLVLAAVVFAGAALGGCSSAPTGVHSPDDYKGTTKIMEEKTPD